jgi:hypothetical protein
MKIFKRRHKNKGPSLLMLTVEHIDRTVQEIQAHLQSMSEAQTAKPAKPLTPAQETAAHTLFEPFASYEPMDGATGGEESQAGRCTRPNRSRARPTQT